MISLIKIQILRNERNKMMSNLNQFLQLFFNWVIETTIVCSILVGLILLIKMVFRNKLPARWHYILWLPLLFRLLLPPLPDGVIQIQSFLPQTKQATPLTMPLPTNQELTYDSNSIKLGMPIKNVSVQKKEPKSISTILPIALYIWIIGVIIIGIITVIANVKLYLYVKRQPLVTDVWVDNLLDQCKRKMLVKKKIPVFFSGEISSPTVLGFIKPKLLLYQDHLQILNKNQLEFVFYHELAHIKRNDIFVNCIMNVFLILHWFNPVLWYAYFRMRQDQEIGCDALALTYIEPAQKVEYGRTLIKLIETVSNSFQISTLANMVMSKGLLKRRIIMIKKFQKKSYRWSVLGVISVAVLLAFAILNLNGSPSLASVYKPYEQKENYKMMTKADILKKMQTSFKYFKTAKGKSIVHVISNGTEITNEIDYEAVNNSTPCGYNKIITTIPKTDEKSTKYTYYNQNTSWDIDKSKSTYMEFDYKHQNSLGRTQRQTADKDKYSINVVSVIEYPLVDLANFYLFPYEIANTYLENQEQWEIEKQNEDISGHNTLVIKGVLDKDLSTSFRFWVDKDTGILVKFETYDKEGNILSYLDPKELTVNGPIDTNALKPNLNGLKKQSR